MKFVAFPSYCFKGLQCENDVKHSLIRSLTDFAPDSYQFTEEPDDNHRDFYPKFMSFFKFEQAWKQQLVELGGKPEWVDWVLQGKTSEPQYIMPSERAHMIPINMPVFACPYIVLTQNEWMIECEDWVPLWFTFFHNGHTANIDIERSDCKLTLKSLFMLDNFRGVITHIRQTIESLTAIFGRELSHKFFYVPLGIEEPAPAKCARNDGTVSFLFSPSQNSTETHFQFRGGYYFLEAFKRVEHKYPQIRFTLMYDELCLVGRDRNGVFIPNLPSTTIDYIRNHPKIRWIKSFLPKAEYDQEMQEADVYVLPAYRTHSYSLGQALSRGVPCLVSSGWGIDEFVQDGYNGWRADFSPQCNSWVDEKGIMREEYKGLNTLDLTIVDNLCKKIDQIMQNPAQIAEYGANARKTYEDKLTIKHRNECLKQVFDQQYRSFR